MKAVLVAFLAATLLPTLGCSKLLAKKSAPIDEPLSQSMTSKNGYAVIHYPSSFAGKKIDEAGVQAGRNITLSTDEALVVLAIPNPIADEVAEVAGWLSPRIGGVGPMTRAMLLWNAVGAAERRAG